MFSERTLSEVVKYVIKKREMQSAKKPIHCRNTFVEKLFFSLKKHMLSGLEQGGPIPYPINAFDVLQNSAR